MVKKTVEDYATWLEKQDFSDPIDESVLRDRIESELKVFSSMPVEEYTLYKKWQEIHEKYPITERTTLFGKEVQTENTDTAKYLESLKKNIWGLDFTSKDDFIDSYKELEPELVFANNNEYTQDWSALRVFISTMRNNNTVGRKLHYIIRDRRTKKYMGVICLSSDFMDLTARDKFIGWTGNNKIQQRMINHVCMGSTIVPTQPLGYNYLGGKLLALLCVTDDIEKKWKEIYNDTLVGVTTTSLYGTFSQYDRLSYWKAMGSTSGSLAYELTRDTENQLINWLRIKYPEKYWYWYTAHTPEWYAQMRGKPLRQRQGEDNDYRPRQYRNRSFKFAYSNMNIPNKYLKTEHSRGVYFCPLFDNTQDFLCNKIGVEDLKRRFDNSSDSLVAIWKEKYAKKRIEKLYADDRIKNESLFYDDMIYLSWEETKSKYLSIVGRNGQGNDKNNG